MIEQLTECDDINSEEEKRLEEEIRETQKMINEKDQTRSILRIAREIPDTEGNQAAKFDATINLKINPRYFNKEKQAILVGIMIKDHEVKVDTNVMNDVDMKFVRGLRFEIPVGPSTREAGTRQPVSRKEDSTIITVTTKERSTISETRNESIAEYDSEGTSEPYSETTSSDTVMQEKRPEVSKPVIKT